jgi:hypothetical protein
MYKALPLEDNEKISVTISELISVARVYHNTD